jgi:hypothetical protein
MLTTTRLMNKHAGMSAEGAVVGAWDSGLELRMNASSVGLLAVRVAAAAARSRSGSSLNERDIEALVSVRDDLREEARVLRGESSPDVADETAFAFAGLALTALGLPPGKDELDDEAAVRLDKVADDLEAVAGGGSVAPTTLNDIEQLFLTASAMVSESLGQTGELVEGGPGASVSR